MDNIWQILYGGFVAIIGGFFGFIFQMWYQELREQKRLSLEIYLNLRKMISMQPNTDEFKESHKDVIYSATRLYKKSYGRLRNKVFSTFDHPAEFSEVKELTDLFEKVAYGKKWKRK